MKKYLLYITFAFFSCLTNADLKKSDKLQTPIKKSQDSINESIEWPEVKMLTYLTTYFNKNPDTVFIKKPDFMISENTLNLICGYIISFEEGHFLKHEQECNEWGEIVTVSFKNFKAKQVREIVELLFKNDEYDWYVNDTEYRPEKYYERVWTFKIIENEETTVLEFVCSQV